MRSTGEKVESASISDSNCDQNVVRDFGYEWGRWSYSDSEAIELKRVWNSYFGIVPKELFSKSANWFDMGSGTGRWASLVAPKVGSLTLVEPSRKALEVSVKNTSGFKNIRYLNETANENSLEDNAYDFGYSLGVLHHVPDTDSAIKACAKKIKPGGYFLVYLYYRFDNRPMWYGFLWRISNFGRLIICRLPFGAKLLVCDLIALTVYYPLSRVAGIMNSWFGIRNFPLGTYSDKSLYILRTDALDRFGTRLEKRFSLTEIHEMLKQAGLTPTDYSKNEPYWVVLAKK